MDVQEGGQTWTSASGLFEIANISVRLFKGEIKSERFWFSKVLSKGYGFSNQIERIGRLLAAYGNLKALRINRSDLGKVGFEAVANILIKNPAITDLAIYDDDSLNDFENWSILCDAVANSQTLKVLRLGAQMDGPMCEALRAALSKNSSVSDLYLPLTDGCVVGDVCQLNYGVIRVTHGLPSSDLGLMLNDKYPFHCGCVELISNRNRRFSEWVGNYSPKQLVSLKTVLSDVILEVNCRIPKDLALLIGDFTVPDDCVVLPHTRVRGKTA